MDEEDYTDQLATDPEAQAMDQAISDYYGRMIDRGSASGGTGTPDAPVPIGTAAVEMPENAGSADMQRSLLDLFGMGQASSGGDQAGSTPAPKTGSEAATRPPPRSSYEPVVQDYPNLPQVDAATKAGFGYGSPIAALMQGDARQYTGPTVEDNYHRILGLNKTFRTPGAAQAAVDAISQERMLEAGSQAHEDFFEDVKNPKYGKFSKPSKTMRDKQIQEALLLNRIPIATLGYSPSVATLDTKRGGSSVAGLFSKEKDSIYANIGEADTLAHESVHRGIQQLMRTPEGLDIISKMQALNPRRSLHSMDENITRYIIGKHTGPINPESFYTASNREFEKPEMVDLLNQLDELAQRKIAQRTPRGPR